jgi:cell division septation protein DedD
MTVSTTNILALYSKPGKKAQKTNKTTPTSNQIPNQTPESVGVSGIDVLAAYRTNQAKTDAPGNAPEPGTETTTTIVQSPPGQPNLCQDNYQVINCQYPADNTELPDKLCVFSPSSGVISWYSLITADKQ